MNTKSLSNKFRTNDQLRLSKNGHKVYNENPQSSIITLKGKN